MNPPIVEVWIEFRFQPSDPEAAWNMDVAEAFLKEFDNRFSPAEIGLQYGAEIQPVVEAGGRTFRSKTARLSFDGLRAKADDDRLWLHIRKDAIAVSLVRSKDHVPGYTRLREEASAILEAYFRCFRPIRVTQASLHYRDQVRLSEVNRQRIDLREYFSFWISSPSWLDVPLGRFAFDLTFVPKDDNVLRLKFQSEPSDGESAKFRLDWHLTCHQILSDSPCEIWHRMDKAHDVLLNNFVQSFTEKGHGQIGLVNA